MKILIKMIAVILCAAGPVIHVFLFTLAGSRGVVTFKVSKLIQMFTFVLFAREIGGVSGQKIGSVIWRHALDIGGLGLGLSQLVSTVS